MTEPAAVDAVGAPPPCALLRQEVGEPLAGTATSTPLWIALEHPGPYPRAAVPDLLPPRLAEWSAAAGSALRIQLIRRPTTDRTARDAASRTVLVADASGTRPRLVRGAVVELDEVADWSLDELRRGDLPSGLDAVDQEVLLVCTNGRRDACCARYGRAAMQQLIDDGRFEVWETTHTGGHRFAPAIVSLPTGYQFGGPEATTLTTTACRGRSGLNGQEQAAELAVLERSSAVVPIPLAITRGAGAGAYVVTDPAGQQWNVTVVDERLPGVRPESCGKEPLPIPVRRVVAVTPTTEQDGRTVTTNPERG